MTVDLYAHYGTLAHEATPVYAWGADATDSYDRVSVTIPARYKPYKTMSGELCVRIQYNNDEFSFELVDALNRFSDFCRDCTITKIVE